MNRFPSSTIRHCQVPCETAFADDGLRIQKAPHCSVPKHTAEMIGVKCRPAVILLAALVVMGCVHQPLTGLSHKHSSLQHWLEHELAPYLTQQLGQHPRFKGEPVILVQLDGHDVQSDIDGLTRNLRDQLMDRLLSEPGITLPWQPQRQPAQHHRRLDRVECGRVRDASHYIGIEITRGANSEHRVSVRALDTQAGEWVSGFGRHWNGRLTASEQQALQKRESDESLRGLRVLPFSSSHPDLAATYLANNLSCLLRQQDEDHLVIHVEPLQSDQPHLRTIFRLISHNLSRYREVSVTNRQKEANFLLRAQAYEIHSGLHQVWVALHPENSGEHLSGMDTATWVRSPPTAATAPTPVLAKPIYDPKPLITSLELVRRDRGDTLCTTKGTGRHNHPGCSALELTVENAERVFVFVHDTKDGVSRLSPGRCIGDLVKTRSMHSTRRYAFPTKRFSEPGWPTVYAIAVSEQRLARQFESHLQRLPDACGSSPGIRSGNAIEPWLNDLDLLIASGGTHTSWTGRRIR